MLRDPIRRADYDRRKGHSRQSQDYERQKREQEAKAESEKRQREQAEARKHEQEARARAESEKRQREKTEDLRREYESRAKREREEKISGWSKSLSKWSWMVFVLFIFWFGTRIRFSSFTESTEALVKISPTITKIFPTLKSPTRTPIATFTETGVNIVTSTTAANSDFPDYIDDSGVPMRYAPAGIFIMGSNKGESVEFPVHQVSLHSFYMDKFEVTNDLYKDCVQVSACQSPQYFNSATRSSYYGNPQFGKYPVIFVNWTMAKIYCEWRGARLPTEAEWEYAARGTDGRMYPWGQEIDATYANYMANDTSAVGSYEKGKSPFGLYDMSGNVWEWVLDWFQPDYYSKLSDNISNPQGPLIGSEHVLRGGSWGDNVWDLRASFRYGNPPDYQLGNFGFRCAKDAP